METQPRPRKPYPTDVGDEEWAFVAPYLALVREGAPQRRHELRRVFSALRWIAHTGAPWRYLTGDFPTWEVVYQQTRRWIDAGVFAAMVHDPREMLRWARGWGPRPMAVITDSAARQSTPESGRRAGYDGHKRRKGSEIHAAADTLGELLALLVTPADAQDREQVEGLAATVQEATGQAGEVGFVDQGYTGEPPAAEAARHGIRLDAVKLPAAKRGFVLLPRRWVVERSFAWTARFRRLAKDYERSPEVFAGLHFLAVLTLVLRRLPTIAGQSP
jgi:transposase